MISPRLLSLVLILLMVSVFPLGAQESLDQDRDGVPDSQEIEACLIPISNYFTEGKPIYQIIVNNQSYKGQIQSFQVIKEYERLLRAQAPKTNQALIDLTKQVEEEEEKVEAEIKSHQNLLAEIKNLENELELQKQAGFDSLNKRKGKTFAEMVKGMKQRLQKDTTLPLQIE
ncbi:MAG: hypothetical protein AAFU64_17135, partial [Bacteroidota bacterium]